MKIKSLLFSISVVLFSSFYIKSKEQAKTERVNTVVQLRVQENNVLVGTYNTTTNIANLSNISSFIGSMFKDGDSTEYTASQIFIDHTNGNYFYLNFKGKANDSTGINVGIPLYVGARDTPDVNYLKCPPENHSCKGNICACCKLTKNLFGCYNGCDCEGKQNIAGTCYGQFGHCDHSVSASQGGGVTHWGSFVESIVTDPSS
jgi:hypothetical protein